MDVMNTVIIKVKELSEAEVKAIISLAESCWGKITKTEVSVTITFDDFWSLRAFSIGCLTL